MLKPIKVDLLHVTFSNESIAAVKQEADNKDWQGREVSKKLPTIRNYFFLTFLILQHFTLLAKLFGFESKEDIFEYTFSTAGKNGKEQTETVYLNAREATQFFAKVRKDLISEQDEAADISNGVEVTSTKCMTALEFEEQLKAWEDVGGKVHAKAMSQFPFAANLKVAPSLSSFSGTEVQIDQLTDYLANEAVPREEKLLLFLQQGNLEAIQWLAEKQVEGKAFKLEEFIKVSDGVLGNKIPVSETPLLIVMRRADPEAESIVGYLSERGRASQKRQGEETDYDVKAYKQWGQLIEVKGLSSVKQPYYHRFGKLDKMAGIAASIRMIAEKSNIPLRLEPTVSLVEKPGEKAAIHLQFDKSDEKAFREFSVQFGKSCLAVSDNDLSNRILVISGIQAERFLEEYCLLAPALIHSSYETDQKKDAAQYEHLYSILGLFAPKFKVNLSPKGNPEVQFMVKDKQNAKTLKEKIVKEVRDSLRTEYDRNIAARKQVPEWREPLSEQFQVTEAAPPASGYLVTLTSNETYHLLGFGQDVPLNGRKPGAADAPEKEAEFKKFMKKLGVRDMVYSTSPIRKRYTAVTSIEDQRKAHDEATNLLKKVMLALGGIASFFSPPPSSEKPIIELKDAPLLPSKGGKELNPEVFSRENTDGVQEDIQRDGKRKEDNIIIYGVASQYNSCEAPGRYTVKPGEVKKTYEDDGTQGPGAQLQFGELQIEAINAMGNRGLNAICKVLDKFTSPAISDGYLTPYTPQMLTQVIQQFRKNGDKMEFTCVANVPTTGKKPVYQFLTSAPAFGWRYSLAKLSTEQEKELQFICALHSFRAQFAQAIAIAKEQKKPVVFKPAAIGLGVFGNDAETVAKAFHIAAQEYQADLKDNNVKVKFQVFGGKGEARTLTNFLKLDIDKKNPQMG